MRSGKLFWLTVHRLEARIDFPPVALLITVVDRPQRLLLKKMSLLGTFLYKVPAFRRSLLNQFEAIRAGGTVIREKTKVRMPTEFGLGSLLQFLRYIPLPDTESVEAQTFHPVKLSGSPKGTAETKEGQEQSALHEDWRMLYKFKVPAPY